MTILITGIAGFIAARTASMLIEQGHQVVGIDNLNDYYDIRLKAYRLRELLDWQPVIPPIDGFQKSVDWYRENADWLRQVQV